MKNRELLVELQSYGIRTHGASIPARKGGAGPAEGIILIVEGRPLSVPLESPCVKKSPYELRGENGAYWLTGNGSPIQEVGVRGVPGSYQSVLKDGTPLQKVALLHGSDCLASTVLQSCFLWGTSQACKFCGIGLSLQRGSTTAVKQPEQLAEAAEIALRSDGITHLTLTTGSTRTGETEIKHLAACARSIRARVDLPIHAQFLPPQDAGLLNELKESGVTTVGIHIESFDPGVLARVAPFKSAIGFEQYRKGWEKCVELFGENQVSSFVIIGLGESQASVIEGSRTLAGMGVYPYVVPLRPIPGSEFEARTPPSPQTMIPIYEGVSRILKANGLSRNRSLAGCVRCRACSSLSEFEG